MAVIRKIVTASSAHAVTMQDILLVSSFGFWAVLLGLCPILALHSLAGN
jgi:hypothetical protein